METPNVKTLLDFTNKVVVITGSGSGLGRGIAKRFAEAGANVVVHYNTSAAGAHEVVHAIRSQNVASEMERQAVAVQADLTREGGAARLFAETVDVFGGVNVLINNAGIYPRAALIDMTPAQWDETINANLRSAFLCTQAFARQVIAQGNDGAIVNVTSIEAENPAPMHSHYNTAKGGLLMLTRAAANELASHRIRVNAVAPGLIWREGLDQAWPEGVQRWMKAAPLGRLGTPEDVADACLFLASPAARWITGASLTVDGGVMTHQIF